MTTAVSPPESRRGTFAAIAMVVGVVLVLLSLVVPWLSSPSAALSKVSMAVSDGLDSPINKVPVVMLILGAVAVLAAVVTVVLKRPSRWTLVAPVAFLAAVVVLIVVVQGNDIQVGERVSLASGSSWNGNLSLGLGVWLAIVGAIALGGSVVLANMDRSTGARTCPWCAESIKASARVCRYCGRDVEPQGGSASELA